MKRRPKAPAIDPLQEKMNTIASLQRQCDAYERMLEISFNQIQRSRAESAELQRRITERTSQFDEQQRLTNEKCAGMNRVYRSGQAHLLTRVRSHEAAVRELESQLEDAAVELERLKAEKDAAMTAKVKLLHEKQQQMEDMAIAFGMRLKSALQHVSAGGDRG